MVADLVTISALTFVSQHASEREVRMETHPDNRFAINIFVNYKFITQHKGFFLFSQMRTPMSHIWVHVFNSLRERGNIPPCRLAAMQ
jgi:hypothetical protein